jgi:phosphoribosyl-ATP pyrophosphohydrolase
MSDVLARLEALIAARRAGGSPDQSYVAKQLARGRLKLAEKLGEEAVETVIAAVAQDDDALVAEAADLLFHLLILLGERGISLDAVRAELERREGRSGLDEKAGRSA